MSRHSGQTSLQSDIHSDEEQLATLKQQNERLIRNIKPFGIKNFQNADKVNLLLNTALQIKQHYFAIDHQPFLSLPEKASHVSRIAFL